MLKYLVEKDHMYALKHLARKEKICVERERIKANVGR